MSTGRKDEHLAQAIKSLPEHTPAGDAWEGILNELEGETKPEKQREIGWWRYAAALLLIASASLVIYTIQSGPSDIHFGEELSELMGSLPAESVADEEFETFRDEECSGFREVCELPQFKTLMTELTAVEAEVVNIAEMIETTGYDEFLYKAKNKADQETIRIKKELVKLLRG